LDAEILPPRRAVPGIEVRDRQARAGRATANMDAYDSNRDQRDSGTKKLNRSRGGL
jgi:hypothetical protein